MLRIVPRPPLSANVTLQQRLLPAATRGVATTPPPSPDQPQPRSNDRNRPSVAHFASPSPRSYRIQRFQSLVESPSGSLSVRKISGPVEPPRSDKSLLSARSDPVQKIALESPTGNYGAVDGQHDLNQAATARLDAPAAELVKDLIDKNLLRQLYSPATETAKDRTEENLPPRLDARATEAAKDLAGEHLPPELDSPAAESAGDLAEENLSSLDELSDEDTFRQHLFDTQGDLATDRSDQPESVTHAMPQFDAPSPSVGGGSEPSEQETVTVSSPSNIIQKVSQQTACIRISNLPDNITGSMLLTAISIHGPFGKVLNAHVRHLAGSTHALIDFMSRPIAEPLFKFIRDGKLIIGGREVRCRWHPSEYRIHYKPWRTRVLVVAINQDLANYNFLRRLRALSDGDAKNPDIVVEPILTVGGWVALVCTYLDTGPANYARENLKRDGLRVTFGADPVAVGIVSAYEANLRLGERLIAATFRRQGMMEDQVVTKSMAELAQERLEQHVKFAPPPGSTVKNVSLDPFVAMSQVAYRPTAKRTPLNDSFSFPDDLEEWKDSEDTDPGLGGPRNATSSPAASWPGGSPTTEEQPGAEQHSQPDSNQDPKSHDETADVLEDIEKALERFRKEL